MTIHSSYSKMLPRMDGNSNSKMTDKVDTITPETETETETETKEHLPREFTKPQLTPSMEMGNLLTKILGPSASKKHSPMD
ncbi:hypothetical protein TUM19329_04760 [Legionella antarctica]|uniref:Uncharacterized protein n=1 Tax=Legionella antarctica TaxID=2708020 RepID=A0A6F8T0E2_9GAMM|nr:hypothetical protein [Legionella antarctica]BCA94115.1 hypothetical protein TUM19329_04760 [Legionella antarctica]